MRFSTIFVYLALAAGLAIASPLADRGSDLSLKDAKNSTQPHPQDPNDHHTPTHAAPEGEEGAKLQVVGSKGTTKREDYNPLNERGPATLYLCYYRGCRYCYSYNLEYYEYDRCYWANFRYYSLYVWSYRHLHYGVYVGYYYYPYCRVTRVPYANRCWNIYPYGDVFGKKW